MTENNNGSLKKDTDKYHFLTTPAPPKSGGEFPSWFHNDQYTNIVSAPCDLRPAIRPRRFSLNIGSLGTLLTTFHHPTTLTQVHPSIPRAS